MKIKRRKRNSPEETSAASDVAFLLIIYFLVIAGFNINQGFLLNLPAKDSTRLILKDDLMRFEMDGSGALFYQGAELDRSAAEREIRRAIAGHPNLALILLIDAKAPWQQLVLFVELAQKLNVDSFSFNISEGT
jgi:biopolymer transport protein ExbD